MLRAAFALAAALFLAACGGGPKYADVAASLAPVAPDKSRLVFLKESGFVGSLSSMRIQIDGTTLGDVPNGTALLVDRAPGAVSISCDNAMSFGRWVVPVTLEPGKEYYFEIVHRGAALAAGMFGVVGLAAESAAQPTQRDGPAELRPLGKDAALAKLQSLRLTRL